MSVARVAVARVAVARVGALRVAAVVAAVAGVGIPLGLLWAVVAPEVPVRVTDAGPVLAQVQGEQVAAADAWFAVLSVAAGVVVAAAAWMFAPATRGPAGLLAITVGATAAGLLAWWIGRQVGMAGYEAALETAASGTVLQRPADLRVADAGGWPPWVAGAPLVPALLAAVTYTLLAAWSRYPQLRVDRSQPVDTHGD